MTNIKRCPAARLRGALTSTTPEDALLAVAKRMPVRIRVAIDQRKLNVLLAQCGNSKLPVEVRQVRINRPPAAVGASGMGGGGYGGGMPGGGEGGGGGGGSEGAVDSAEAVADLAEGRIWRGAEEECLAEGVASEVAALAAGCLAAECPGAVKAVMAAAALAAAVSAAARPDRNDARQRDARRPGRSQPD